MPRFVLLRHDWPTPHLDLMLEAGKALKTWRLKELPAPDRPQPAQLIGDHRLVYLDYEGPISGGRGSVQRLDGGLFETIDEKPTLWIVNFQGHLLTGRHRLSIAPHGWIVEVD